MKDARGHGSDGRGGSSPPEFGLRLPPPRRAAAHQSGVEDARRVPRSQLVSSGGVRDAITRMEFNAQLFSHSSAPWKSRTTWPDRQDSKALAMKAPYAGNKTRY